MSSDKNDSAEYIRSLTRRAFRNAYRLDETSIKSAKSGIDEPKLRMPKNRVFGLAVGLAVGIVICFVAYLLGFPFKSSEIAFIAFQFGLLGALASYLNS